MIARSFMSGAIYALAALTALPAAADPRVATHHYQSGEIVTLRGGNNTQSTIAFAPDERIENVAVGDSAGWQVTPNKRADLLFVKPTKPGARTNMTVVTDQRTYLFDLVSAPRAVAVYMLRFTYPAAPPVTAPPVDASAALAIAAPPPANPDPAALDPASLHFAWVSRGDKALIPTRLFDDGTSTFLAWPAETALPAILVREAGGSEGPVNYTVHGDFVVVDGVPAQLVLRSGKQVATLTPGVAPSELSADARPIRAVPRFNAPVNHPGPVRSNTPGPGL